MSPSPTPSPLRGEGRGEGKTFVLEVVTPERTVFIGQATTAVVPAEEGYLGILAHHAPLIAALTPGRITFRSPEGTMTTLQNEGAGFLEVRDNRVTVLAERVAPPPVAPPEAASFGRPGGPATGGGVAA